MSESASSAANASAAGLTTAQSRPSAPGVDAIGGDMSAKTSAGHIMAGVASRAVARRAEHDLSADEHPVSTARAFITDTLRDWGLDADRRFPVELAVSELVANALRHGDGVREVTVNKFDEMIRLEVADRSEGTPVVLRPGELEEGHRGLLIIETVSSRWGYERGDQGKCVWAEFDGATIE